MNSRNPQRLSAALRWIPLVFLVAIGVVFSLLSPRFAAIANIGAILVQSSWLVTVALGVNFVLLTAGVDLSVGAIMYVAAVAVGLGFAGMPVALAVLAALAVGAVFGALNGALVIRLQLQPFIVTLATAFIGRGVGLFLSETKVITAGPRISAFGRSSFLGVPSACCFAVMVIVVAWTLMHATEFGPYVRSIGADREGARRAGVPVAVATCGVYVACGALAGLAGFISLSETASASAAFGTNAEFLAIAAAVLGGTSLFGGYGNLWGPIVGAVLITTVQNGMVMVNANPYAYPVSTGLVIFCAVAIDALRVRLVTRMERRRITAIEETRSPDPSGGRPVEMSAQRPGEA